MDKSIPAIGHCCWSLDGESAVFTNDGLCQLNLVLSFHLSFIPWQISCITPPPGSLLALRAAPGAVSPVWGAFVEMWE